MNLIIGLCLGAASAVALVIMWRMVARLRKELESRDSPSADKQAGRRDDVLEDF